MSHVHQAVFVLTDGLVHMCVGMMAGVKSGQLFTLWLRKKMQRGD